MNEDAFRDIALEELDRLTSRIEELVRDWDYDNDGAVMFARALQEIVPTAQLPEPPLSMLTVQFTDSHIHATTADCGEPCPGAGLSPDDSAQLKALADNPPKTPRPRTHSQPVYDTYSGGTEL